MTPLRRVRRVLRWLSKCGEQMPNASGVHHSHAQSDSFDRYLVRCDTADELFAHEIEFVAKLALAELERRNKEKPKTIPVRSPICPKCGVDERSVTIASSCNCDDDGGAL